jgi:signal peptidase II
VVGGAILLVGLSLFGYDFDTAGRRRPDGAAQLGVLQPDAAPDEAGRPKPGDAAEPS